MSIFAKAAGVPATIIAVALYCLLPTPSAATTTTNYSIVLFEQTSNWDWAFSDNSFLSQLVLTQVETGIEGIKHEGGKLISNNYTPVTKVVTLEKSYSTTRSYSETLSTSLSQKIKDETSGVELGTTLNTSITFAESRTETEKYTFTDTLKACCSTDTLMVWDIFTRYSGTFEWVEDGWLGSVTYHTGTWSILDFTGMGSEHVMTSNEPCPVPAPAALLSLISGFGTLAAFGMLRPRGMPQITAL